MTHSVQSFLLTSFPYTLKQSKTKTDQKRKVKLNPQVSQVLMYLTDLDRLQRDARKIGTVLMALGQNCHEHKTP